MTLFYFVNSCEECACFVEGDYFTFFHFLKHSTIANQNSIFDSNIEDNSNHAWYSKSKCARTRSNQYTNSSLNNPTDIAPRNSYILEAEEEKPSCHHQQGNENYGFYEIFWYCFTNSLNPWLTILLFVLS